MKHGPLRIADHLAGTPVGPELAAVLASVNVDRLDGYDTVGMFKADYRQEAHSTGRRLHAVWHVARCGRDAGAYAQRLPEPDAFASHEVKSAASLTKGAGSDMIALAQGLFGICPELGAAMLAGELDLDRAKMLLFWTSNLSDAHRVSIFVNLLPRVSLSANTALTTGQLAREIARLAIKLDPDWAHDRYEKGVRERDVRARLNPDGTADLTGSQLPPDRVSSAVKRINTLAKAAIRQGDPRPVAILRAEIYLCLTEGSWVGLDDLQILDALRQSRPSADSTDLKAPAASRQEIAPGVFEMPVAAQRTADGIELKIGLKTMLGLDRKPAEIAGMGWVGDTFAVDLVNGLGGAQWRWITTDHAGHLQATGLTPARPAGIRLRDGECTSIVNLHVPAHLLAVLAEADRYDPPFGMHPVTWEIWRPVLLDIAERAARFRPPEDDPKNRFASAALRRIIQIRDTQCVGIGCRAPATASEIDHLKDHAKGGPTDEINEAPACKYDHTVKHKAGWKVKRTDAGYLWTSRLGHTYLVPHRPVDPDAEPDLPPF